MSAVTGIHHVTAMASRPQANLDFYVGTLGMRLVKRSVNQDDPGTYHFFYADGAGTPGTDLTFFPWLHIAPPRRGSAEIAEVSLTVPVGSLSEWRARLTRAGVSDVTEATRFGERSLAFSDPDGLPVVLVESAASRDFTPWEGGGVGVSEQVRGLHAVRIRVRDLGPTRAVLTELLGLADAGQEDGWTRFAAAGGGPGTWVDVLETPDTPPARLGRGSIHHVAWRVPDDATQAQVRDALARAGLQPTPVIDRFWFRSVYFQEPGGTIFEIATDGPGFAVDEAPERLGETLVLPPWLEPHRSRIEAVLPPVELPMA
ncbi:MAG: ring-cleaving dioxygenase [Gemmatimonadota bacterium]